MLFSTNQYLTMCLRLPMQCSYAVAFAFWLAQCSLKKSKPQTLKQLNWNNSLHLVVLIQT